MQPVPDQAAAAPDVVDAPGAEDVPHSFRDFLGPVHTKDAPAHLGAGGGGSSPFPGGGAGAPFPKTGSGSPFPPTDVASPFRSTDVASPFPPTDAASPFPKTGSDSPFPPSGGTSARTGPKKSKKSTRSDRAERDVEPAAPPASSPDPEPSADPSAEPAPETSDRAPAPHRAHRAHRAHRLDVPRFLDRRLTLVAAAVVALALGVGASAAQDLLAREPAPDLPATTPQECAAIQAAWTDSAAAQVDMTADDPGTLYQGFLGARDALEGVPTPSGAAQDWRLVVTYIDTVATALESVDPADGEAITAAVGEAFAGLDTLAATDAAARVTAYLKEGCPA